MINALGHTGTHKAGSELRPLVDQLARRADTNRDGQVSKSEFSEFLATLMQSLESTAPAKDETAACTPTDATLIASRER